MRNPELLISLQRIDNEGHEQGTPLLMSKITLRDLAAVAAMQGLLSAVKEEETPAFESIGLLAVRYADALLTELEKGKPL